MRALVFLLALAIPSAAPAAPRHRAAMANLIAGSIAVSLGFTAITIGLGAAGKYTLSCRGPCRDEEEIAAGTAIYATTVGASLVGLGVPLLIHGAQQERDARALRITVAPYATSTSGGLAACVVF